MVRRDSMRNSRTTSGQVVTTEKSRLKKRISGAIHNSTSNN
jgi:hypothetical protein